MAGLRIGQLTSQHLGKFGLGDQRDLIVLISQIELRFAAALKEGCHILHLVAQALTELMASPSISKMPLLGAGSNQPSPSLMTRLC